MKPNSTNSQAASKPFNSRSFVALAAALAGIGLPFSGLAIHLLHGPGRASAGARHSWMTAHTSLGVLFLVFAIWHICLNWRPFICHLKRGALKKLPISRETAAALAVVIGVTAIAVSHTFGWR